MEFLVSLFSEYSFQVAIAITVGAACWFLIKYILADHNRDREEWKARNNRLYDEIRGEIKEITKKIDKLCNEIRRTHE